MGATNKPHLPTNGPTGEDCLRLWRTLTTEYIPDLRLELEPVEIDHKHTAIAVRITSTSAHQGDKTEVVNMWAMKVYQNELYLISMAQLFDLLIVAYRAIDGYFTLGEALRPSQVKR